MKNNKIQIKLHTKRSISVNLLPLIISFIVLSGCSGKRFRNDVRLFNFTGNIKSIINTEKYTSADGTGTNWNMVNILYFNKKGDIDSARTTGEINGSSFGNVKIYTHFKDGTKNWQEFNEDNKLKRFGSRVWLNEKSFVDTEKGKENDFTKTDKVFIDKKGRLDLMWSVITRGTEIRQSSLYEYKRDGKKFPRFIVHTDRISNKKDSISIEILQTDENGNPCLTLEKNKKFSVERKRDIEYYKF